MKKLILFALSAACVFLCACTAVPLSEDKESKPDFYAEDLYSELKDYIDVLNECAHETFGAEISGESFNDIYIRLYDGSAEDVSEKEPVKLIPYSEVADKDFEEFEEYVKSEYGLEPDPSYAYLFKVNNFKTNADVRDYLQKYMTPEVVDSLFNNDFQEFDGSLYLVRGGRGYGAVSYDVSSLKFVEEKDGAYYVTININLFDNFDTTAKLEFSYDENNILKISKISENN